MRASLRAVRHTSRGQSLYEVDAAECRCCCSIAHVSCYQRHSNHCVFAHTMVEESSHKTETTHAFKFEQICACSDICRYTYIYANTFRYIWCTYGATNYTLNSCIVHPCDIVLVSLFLLIRRFPLKVMEDHAIR